MRSQYLIIASVVFVLYHVKLVIVLRAIHVNTRAHLEPGQTSRMEIFCINKKAAFTG